MSQRASESLTETPVMDDLVCDVRETDRALRDGTWAAEYEMLDSGSRHVVGWIVAPIVVLVLGYPALLVFARVAGISIRAAFMLLAAVAALMVGGWGWRRQAVQRRHRAGGIR